MYHIYLILPYLDSLVVKWIKISILDFLMTITQIAAQTTVKP